jgi:hypothetical protein
MKTIAIARSGLLTLGILTACTPVIRNGPIVSGYENAECIPVHLGSGIPPTRSWDYSTLTRGAKAVKISGAQVPSGRIDVQYLSDGVDMVAADAGDYIYPADVRLDRSNDKLYVKASGIPVFGKSQTWLFEFDLNDRRQIGRARVYPTVLPQECR